MCVRARLGRDRTGPREASKKGAERRPDRVESHGAAVGGQPGFNEREGGSF